jgi:hypothetical protein
MGLKLSDAENQKAAICFFFEFYSTVTCRATIPQIAGSFALRGRMAACFALGGIFYDSAIDGP